MPPTKKQTARKTTGSHFALTSATLGRPSPKSKPTRRGASSPRSKPTLAELILKRPLVAASPSPASVPPTSASVSPSSLDTPLSAAGSDSLYTHGVGPASGALIRRRPAVGVLDMPISVCTRFATWLENQTCVHDGTLLHAVERDGRHFLGLAKATVMFDDALRGHVPPAMNGTVNPLTEHARTLRVFAELLAFKIAEGSLSEELETAVLRDGEALLRLAICCLEFDQTIRGSGSGSGSSQVQ